MTATITKLRRLRTGSGGFDSDKADLSDPYLVRINEQVDQAKVLELLVDYTDFPIPKSTTKLLGDKLVVCDRIDVDNINQQRFLWSATVKWKELEDTPPEDRSSPTPNSDSTDPVDWIPTVTRRPASVMEPMEYGYYEGGYDGIPDDILSAAATANTKSPLVNSAMMPFQDNLPQRRRNRSIISIKWLRAGTSIATLLDYENTLNDRDVIFTHRGFNYVWAAKTALIESISLSETKWGNMYLWEISMEILHDPQGHVVSTLDKGYAEGYFTGEDIPGAVPGSGYTPASTFTKKVIKENGRPLNEPVLLDGEGKRLFIAEPPDPMAPAVFGLWRDQELSDFNSIPLLGDKITNDTP